MRQILVTGAAGFIGFHLSKRLLEDGYAVVGVDDLNNYYDVTLKKGRLRQLEAYEPFRFTKMDLADRTATEALFGDVPYDAVVHLAAQAGVRYSLDHPYAYIDSNLVGFANVLEGARRAEVEHLVFASSSSVYGANRKRPHAVSDRVDHPVSLYAATKKSNELLAHSYAHLHGLPVTGLRFFSVYGPWGRPDMAYFLFAEAIRTGEPIQVFGHGEMERDMTYVDDVVEGVVRTLKRPPRRAKPPQRENAAPRPGAPGSAAPYRIFNIGRGKPVGLMHFIEVLERALGREAKKEFLPMQPGDMRTTCADVSGLEEAVGYRPQVGVEEGIRRFAEWYKAYRSLGAKVNT